MRPMEARGFLADLVFSLDDAIFNFLLNVLPDDHFSNCVLRPRLARMLGLRCGPGVQIRKDVYFEWHRDIEVGSDVILNRQSYFDGGGGIRIGRHVRFGPQVMIITGVHEIGESAMRAGRLWKKGIVIGDGCWVGARVTVTGGVRLGEGCVVSSGSVVQRSMSPNYLVAGNPARPVSLLKPAADPPESGDPKTAA
jgi:maltose O-acetyltransferase